LKLDEFLRFIESVKLKSHQASSFTVPYVYPYLQVRIRYLLSSLRYNQPNFFFLMVAHTILHRSPYYSVHFIFVTSLLIRSIIYCLNFDKSIKRYNIQDLLNWISSHLSIYFTITLHKNLWKFLAKLGWGNITECCY